MEHISDWIFDHIRLLRRRIIDAEHMTVDEKNRAVDELDDLQETLAYRKPL